MSTGHENMQTYTGWLAEIIEYLVRLQAHVSTYASLTNLHALYDADYSVERGAYAVLEVAARHGNADARYLLGRKEKLRL